jgi:transposase
MRLNISFINIFKLIIQRSVKLKHFYFKKHPNTKHCLTTILKDIFYILKTGIAWRDIRSRIKWQTLYFHYNRFVKFNIFKKLFIYLKNKHIKHIKQTNGHIQIIDSSFIMNKYGINKMARNKFFKNKNCNKISIITDVNGIPLSVLINKGTLHDIKFLDGHFKDLIYINKQNNNPSSFLLADKAYVSKKYRKMLKTINCRLMVPKKKNMIVNNYFDKKLYKKRIVVEQTFQKFKVFRRIHIRYDKLFRNYSSFVYFGASILIHNYLDN